MVGVCMELIDKYKTLNKSRETVPLKELSVTVIRAASSSPACRVETKLFSQTFRKYFRKHSENIFTNILKTFSKNYNKFHFWKIAKL